MSMKQELNEVVCSSYFVRHLIFFVVLGLYIYWLLYNPIPKRYNGSLLGMNVTLIRIEPIGWWWLIYTVLFHLIYTYTCFGKRGYKAIWSDAPITYGYTSIFMFLVFFLSYSFSYSKLRSLTSELKHKGEGIIISKKYRYTELSGGGRGGKSSNSSHDVHYESTDSSNKHGSIGVSKKKYQLYQEGDTIILEYYTSFVQDFTRTIYYPSKSKEAQE